MAALAPEVPLCVDLDGTLIRSDLLFESFLLLIRRNPLFIFAAALWLVRGKAVLKAQIARRVQIDPASLPYQEDLLRWLRSQHEQGRELWLCTASNHRLADRVAQHLGIFHGTLSSSDERNLAGGAKAGELVARFGESGFDYCGNHRVDLAIWKRSRGAVVVGGPRLAQDASRLGEVQAVFPVAGHRYGPLLRALRLHQWAKNMLVFVPLAAVHRVGDLPLLANALLAFLAFGMCASSAYVLNDMLDLEVDRLHPRKAKRPFASGDLPLAFGFVLVPLLLAVALALASAMPLKFRIALAGYYGLTLAYSLGLKRIVLVDVVALAGLYTVRVVAGAKAISVPLSFWMLIFSVFLFLSLALVKRYAELDAMRRQGRLAAAGRGYHVGDLPILHSFGAASGYLCVLVLALYINSPAVEPLYRHPQLIWFLCVLLLYWTSRVWFLAHRGRMHDDPLVFALKDKVSLAVGVLAALTVVAAI